MKKLSLAVALAALVLAPQAGRAVTGNVDVTARIAPPLRITPVAPLDFGLLLTDGINAGTSVVDTAGAEVLTNLIQLGTASAGSFDLSGRGGATVSSFSIAGTVLNCATDTDPLNDCLGGGTTTITISAPTATFAPGDALPAGAGLQTASVSYGAQLDTAINQEAGLYAGTLVVTAAY